MGRFDLVLTAADYVSPRLETRRPIVVVIGVAFTDDPLTTGVSTVKAVHIVELRSRIDALLARLGLSQYAFVDSSLTPAVTQIRTQHVIDVRTAP